MAFGGMLGGSKGPNIFHTILMVVFGLAIAGGVAALALYQTVGIGSVSLGPLSLWGTLPKEEMAAFINALKEAREEFSQLSYTEWPPDHYYEAVVDALAAGRGPDVILIDNANLIAQAEKLYPLPYESFDERKYRSSYIEATEVFLRPDGILAFPFSVDPLVMYWNRDLFAAAGIANPPRYWDELVDEVPKLAVVTESQQVRQAAVAMGTYDNVTNAKAILSLLWLQAGVPISQWRPDGSLRVVFESRSGKGDAANAAVRFYTAFADPLKAVYTWNPSLPSSRDMFVAGDLAIYFGFASEFRSLQEANPNLNFDVAMVPQPRSARRPITYARVIGFAVPKASPSIGNAFRAIFGLTDEAALRIWNDISSLPPVHRTLLAEQPTDAVGRVWYYAALNSRSWLEPDPRQTDALFRRMIEDIASGRRSASEALRDLQESLQRIVPKQ